LIDIPGEVSPGDYDFTPEEVEPVVEKTFGEQVLEYLTLQDPVNKALGLSDTPLATTAANVIKGVTTGTGTAARGLGTFTQQTPIEVNPEFKQAMSGVSDMNALDRLAAERNAEYLDPYSVPMTREREFAAAEPNVAFNVGEKLMDIGEDIGRYAEANVPGYEGTQDIYKNLKAYEDVVGFEPGQVDPALLAAVGKGPGDVVQMGEDMGFDASTMAQKSLEGLGSTATTLAPALIASNPLTLATSAGLGYASVTGEIGREASTALEDLYAAGRLQMSDNWKNYLDANEGDEQKALTAMKQAADQEAMTYAAALGGGGNLAEAAMLRSPLGLVSTPVIEAAQEGPGESVALQQVLQNVTGLNVPLNYKNMLEEGTAGFGGGTAVQTGTTAASALDVSKSPTAGQVAQAPATVTSAYKQAAETMGEAGVGGVGDTMRQEIAPDKFTVAEDLMLQQLEDQGGIDVTELDGLGLTLNEVQAVADSAISKKLDSDYEMLLGLAEESVLETGGVPAELVEEINTRMDDLGAPEKAGEILDNALNRPFVSNEGKTRMEIMAENAREAGAASVAEKPASGIETVLGAEQQEQLELPLTEEQQRQAELEAEQQRQAELEAQRQAELEAEQQRQAELEAQRQAELEAEQQRQAEQETAVEVEVKEEQKTPTVVEQVQIDEPDDDEEKLDPEPDVVVEVDEEPQPEVPVITRVDPETGETITECPEGYTLVEGTDGPTCMMSVTDVRQRAGASTRAYTGLAGNVGRSGPGQKRRVTTSTRRVAPTTRRA
jgi:hypothetical protein